MNKKPNGQSLEELVAIANQLNHAKEQIDDIKGMIESEEHYFKIIKQIEATRIVLNITERMLLENRKIAFY